MIILGFLHDGDAIVVQRKGVLHLLDVDLLRQELFGDREEVLVPGDVVSDSSDRALRHMMLTPTAGETTRMSDLLEVHKRPQRSYAVRQRRV